MKLKRMDTNAEISLPNDLLWQDEFKWSSVARVGQYSLAGSLIIEQATKLAGRPITLEALFQDMAWIQRHVLADIQSWVGVPELVMLLTLEYPSDTRSFYVVFAPEETPVEAEPVKEFPGHDPDDWFRVTIRLVEVTAPEEP